MLNTKEIIAYESRGVALPSVIIQDNVNNINSKNAAMDLMLDKKQSLSYTGNNVDYTVYNDQFHPLDLYKLKIQGLINTQMVFTLNQIKQYPKYKVTVVMECAGSPSTFPQFDYYSPLELQPIYQTEWTGCLLIDVIESLGGFKDDAGDILFIGADVEIDNGKVHNYQRSLNIDSDDIIDDCLLVYEMNGNPLSNKHGFPLRLIVPGWYGMASVKYLKEIKIIPYKFNYKYQSSPDLELKQSVGIIRARAIINSPGISDLFTGIWYLKSGINLLQGQCWVGGSTYLRNTKIIDIASVELSFDSGNTWVRAEITEHRSSLWGWNKWEYLWNTSPGLYNIFIRAIDTDGVIQPTWSEQESLDYNVTVACQRVTICVQ